MTAFRHGIIATRRRNKQLTLIIKSFGDGSVTDPGEGTFKEKKNKEITLLAVPDRDAEFIKWLDGVKNEDETITEYISSEKVGPVDNPSASITLSEDSEIAAKFDGEEPESEDDYPEEEPVPFDYQLWVSGSPERGQSLSYSIKKFNPTTLAYEFTPDQWLASAEDYGGLFQIQGNEVFNPDVLMEVITRHEVIPEINGGITFRVITHKLKFQGPDDSMSGFDMYRFNETELRWHGENKPLLFVVMHEGTPYFIPITLTINPNQPALNLPLKADMVPRKTPNIAVREWNIDYYPYGSGSHLLGRVAFSNKGAKGHRYSVFNNPNGITNQVALSSVKPLELPSGYEHDLFINEDIIGANSLETPIEFDLIFSDFWETNNPGVPWEDAPECNCTMWDWATVKVTNVCACFEIEQVDFAIRIEGYNNPNCLLHEENCPLDVTIPDTINNWPVEYIQSRVFEDLGITSVILPENLTIISYEAFENNNITTISFPASLTTIGNRAFLNNPITDIDFTGASSLVKIDNNAFENNSILNLDFTGASSLVEIGSEAFRNNGMISADFSSTTNLEIIKEYAFYENSLAGTVSFQGSLATIEQFAFHSNAIETLTFESLGSLIQIGDRAFQNNQISGNLSLPTSIQTIGMYAFGINQIGQVDFSDLADLTTIGNYAFTQNSISGTVSFCESLVSLGIAAFFNNLITSVIFSEGIEMIPQNVFKQNSITSITFADSITTIGESAFQDNDLASITLSANLETIYEYAFADNSITTIGFPAFSNLNSIKQYAFANNSIETITIPEGVTWLGDGVFSGNPLTTITLPDSLTALGILPDSITQVTVGPNLTIYSKPGIPNPDKPGHSGFTSAFYLEGEAAGTYGYDNGTWSRL